MVANKEVSLITVETDAKKLDTAFAVMQVIDRDVIAVMSDKQWYMRTVSVGHDVMAVVEAKVDGGQDFSMGLEVEKFRKALALVGPRAKITVGDGSVVVEGDGMRKRLPTVDVKTPMPVKQLEYPAMFVCTVKQILRLIKAIDKDQDAVRFHVSPDRVYIEALSDVAMGVSMTLTESDMALLVADTEEKAEYNAERWLDILKVLPAEAQVTVSIGTDYPAELLYEDEDLRVRWMIAPRIVEE